MPASLKRNDIMLNLFAMLRVYIANGFMKPRRYSRHIGRLKRVAALFMAISATAAYGEIIIEGKLTHIYEADPGETYRGSIIVKNIADAPEELKIYQTDYFFFADGRVLYEDAGSVERSNGPWIEFFPKRFSVPARSSAQVNYTITVPDKPGLSGTYWSMLMIEGIPPGSAESSSGDTDRENIAVGIMQLFRYGIQMVTQISGTGSGEPRIIGAQLVKEEAEKALKLDVENSGDRWLRITAWADLYDAEGNYVGKYDGGGKRLYPGTSVRFVVDLNDVPLGVYKALVVLDAGEGGVFGANYTLRLE